MFEVLGFYKFINIKSLKINPDRVAFLKPEELDPDKYETIIKKKKK